MRVHFTYIPEFVKNSWDGAPTVDLVKRVLGTGECEHEIITRPNDADLIIYLDPVCFKNRAEAEVIVRQELILKYPEKCFVWNCDDYPVDFLPGLYVSMPRNRLDSRRARAWCYPASPNEVVSRRGEVRGTVEPRWLFSFRGTNTALVRAQLFERFARRSCRFQVSEIPREKFYRLTSEEKDAFAQEILESKFVLCPRGLATSTHRLYETMELGRVPVILADAWAAPAGPGWSEFSVSVPENEIEVIPELLSKMENKAEEMGQRARRAWEEWFSPFARVRHGIEMLGRLKSENPIDEREFQKEWFRSRFYWRHGLTKPQRIWHRIRNGELLATMARRLRKGT